MEVGLDPKLQQIRITTTEFDLPDLCSLPRSERKAVEESMKALISRPVYAAVAAYIEERKKTNTPIDAANIKPGDIAIFYGGALIEHVWDESRVLEEIHRSGDWGDIDLPELFDDPVSVEFLLDHVETYVF